MCAIENTAPIVQEETFAPILYLIRYHGDVADAIKRQIEVVSDGRRVEKTVNGTLEQPASSELSLPEDAIDQINKMRKS